MSDRLAELQRQRALAQEQVAWFDREIAKEKGQASATDTITTAPFLAAPAQADFAAQDAVAAREGDDIIAQYQEAPGNAARDAKKGCYVWFAFVMAIVVLAGASIYFLYR